MSTSSGNANEALLSHLRADLELKSEMLRALRAELRERTVALSLLPGELDSSALERATSELVALTDEVAEYAAAAAGQLTLAHSPVNLRQLLSCIEATSALELRVAAEVPERVLSDVSRLTRVLCYFVEQCTDAIGSPASALEVNCGTGTTDPMRVEVKFLLRHSVSEREPGAADGTASGELMNRLRAALGHMLCDLMGAQISLTTLTMVLDIAEDQAQTGRFRLALADGGMARPASLWQASVGSQAVGAACGERLAVETRRSDETSIDLLYLDRQLGSLAPVVLERTAPAFISNAQRRMTELHVAREVEDLKRLRTVAHIWKGSALSVGARGLASLLDGIEKQAASNRSPGPGPIWQVRRMLDRVLRALDRYGEVGVRHERA